MASKRYPIELILPLRRLIFYRQAKEKYMKGLELKIARIRANLKQWQLASKVGISQNRLSQFELDRQPIPPELAVKIERLLSETKKTHPTT